MVRKSQWVALQPYRVYALAHIKHNYAASAVKPKPVQVVAAKGVNN